MAKYLTLEGLTYFWAGIKAKLSDKVDKVTGKGLSTNDLTSTLKTNYDSAYTHSTSAHAPSGAQVNIIESIKKNGTALTISSKAVDISVPTKVSEITNDSGFQTAAQVQTVVNTAIAGVYRVKGSIAFASLPTTGMVAGDVYNITNAFTTDAKFLEGAGKSYPAGTNVAYTSDSKWDCLAGDYDLSIYAKSSDIVVVTNAEIDTVLAG